MPLRFDLQSHSTHSDGELSAAGVVAAAAQAGVELLALSDHDTVGGVSEALEAGAREGVRVVPAIEISAIDGGGLIPRELHILGYVIEHNGRVLTKRLEEFLADREQRTLRMAASLRELGFELDEAEINDRLAAGKPIGRPHLAKAVLGPDANAPRLKAENIDDRGDPRRGRSRDLGSPLLGHLRRGRGARHDRPLPRTRHRRRRGVLRDAHPSADRAARQAL
jgi:hypothetical protein